MKLNDWVHDEIKSNEWFNWKLSYNSYLNV